MTKDDLLKEVWPDSFVEESNLAYHVFALRRALGDTDGERYVEMSLRAVTSQAKHLNMVNRGPRTRRGTGRGRSDS